MLLHHTYVGKDDEDVAQGVRGFAAVLQLLWGVVPEQTTDPAGADRTDLTEAEMDAKPDVHARETGS